MKKTRIFCVILAIFLLCVGFAPKVNAAGDLSVTSGCHSVDAMHTVSSEGKLLETSKAVFLYERNSDTLIYTYNPDGQIYPSSMVKLMTALLALENAQLDETVIVTRRALSQVDDDAVKVSLVSGEELSMESLLYCLMTASANDAAVVVAEHVGGTHEGFVEMMNKRAAELGMTGTVYANAHGLHDVTAVTTARDICRLLDYALDNPMFRKLFDATEYTVPATNRSEERNIVTTNHMTSKATIKKYYDERVTGGKTGATDQAGRCLAVTAEGGGMELLSIVMGAVPTYEPNGLALATFGSFEETKILLDYALESFCYRQVFYANQAINQFPVNGGTSNVVVGPGKGVSTVLPPDVRNEELTWIYGEATGVIHAPVTAGQQFSTVQVWHGSRCIAQADLVALCDVPVWKEIKEPARNPVKEFDVWAVVIIVLVSIVVLAAFVAVGMWLLPVIRKAWRDNRRRNRRQDRRRSR